MTETPETPQTQPPVLPPSPPLAPPTGPPGGQAIPPELFRQQLHLHRLRRNAKQNCIAMFVLFLAALATTIGGTMMAIARGTVGQSFTVGCLWIFAVAGGVFAAIYLPVRWKTLTALEPPFKVLGLIGGFGLIAIALLAGVVIVVAAAAS